MLELQTYSSTNLFFESHASTSSTCHIREITGFKQLQIPMQKQLLLPDACSIPWELPSVKCNCTVSSQGLLQAASYQALTLGAVHALEELQKGVFSYLEVVITCIQPIMGTRQWQKQSFLAFCCYLLLILQQIALEMQKGNSAFSLLKHKLLISLFWIVSQRPGRER